MSSTIRGVIRGKTIELTDDPKIADGQRVEVTIRTKLDPAAQLEAILRTAGSMADDPEFAAIMDEVERYRHTAQYRDLVE